MVQIKENSSLYENKKAHRRAYKRFNGLDDITAHKQKGGLPPFFP